jgi:hypothetical protein
MSPERGFCFAFIGKKLEYPIDFIWLAGGILYGTQIKEF